MLTVDEVLLEIHKKQVVTDILQELGMKYNKRLCVLLMKQQLNLLLELKESIRSNN